MNSIETIFLPIETKSKTNETPDDYKNTSANCVAERIGEIFRLSKNVYTFVCVHCSQEFQYFSEFTIHIENHFEIILKNIKDDKIDEENCDVIVGDFNKSLIVEDDDGDNYIGNNKVETILKISNEKYFSENNKLKQQKNSALDFEFSKNLEPDAEGLHNCPQCSQKCKSVSALNRHMFTHLKNKPFQCDICFKSFAQKRYILEHLRLRHKKPADTFQASRDAKKRKCDARRTFECYLCHREFNIRQTFYAHFKSHVESPQLCLVCGVSCSTKYSLQRHMLHHEPRSNTFKCDTCEKSFTMRRYLLTHMREKHPPINHGVADDALKNLPLPEFCTICNKSFINRNYFRQHMKKHTTAKPYKCHICGWEFHERGNLNRHINAHTGEKPYYCKICNKSFATRYGKDHERTHTGEKKHQCTECGFRFISASALRRHSVRHTQIKKYKCDQCPNAYARSDKLLDHKRKHTGEMKHVCAVCGKGYVEKRSWKKHMYTHEAADAQITKEEKNEQN